MYGVGVKLNYFAQPIDDMICTVLDMIFCVYFAELEKTISHSCCFSSLTHGTSQPACMGLQLPLN